MQLHLTLVTLIVRGQGHSDFETLYIVFCKGAELGHMLLLNINRKVCMESPLVQLHLTFVNLKGHSQGHFDFEGLYLVKERS